MPSSSQALQNYLESQDQNLELDNNNPQLPVNSNEQYPQTGLWDTFDATDEWETLDDTPRTSTLLDQRILRFNSLQNGRRLLENWNKIIPQLHGVYMWLKMKTGNWTFNNSFDSFEDKFCSCDQFSYRDIDFVDLMCMSSTYFHIILLCTMTDTWSNPAQKRIKQKFCKCLPDVVRLLTMGYIASSPICPRTAFSVRLLHFHNLAWQWCNVATFPFTNMLA
jgi:hypothetical protein